MSICIASIADRSGAIVAATDQRLSLASGAIDHAVVKGNFIGFEWFAMWAALDISPIPSILNRVKVALKNDGTNRHGWPASEVSEALARAYQDESRTRAVAEILSPFDLDLDGFKANGARVFGARHAEKVDRLATYDLSVQFLVAGFHGIFPSVFSVGPRGIMTDWTQFGMAAVGSGESLSYVSLGLGMHTKNKPIQDTVYAVLDAKFSAEPADGVGPHTTAIVLTPHGGIHVIPAAVIDSARASWEKRRITPPPRAIKAIDDWWKPIADTSARRNEEAWKQLGARPVQPDPQSTTPDPSAPPPSPESPGGSDGS